MARNVQVFEAETEENVQTRYYRFFFSKRSNLTLFFVADIISYLIFPDGMQLLLRGLGIRVIGALHIIVLRGQT